MRLTKAQLLRRKKKRRLMKPIRRFWKLYIKKGLYNVEP